MLLRTPILFACVGGGPGYKTCSTDTDNSSSICMWEGLGHKTCSTDTDDSSSICMWGGPGRKMREGSAFCLWHRNLMIMCS